MDPSHHSPGMMPTMSGSMPPHPGYGNAVDSSMYAGMMMYPEFAYQLLAGGPPGCMEPAPPLAESLSLRLPDFLQKLWNIMSLNDNPEFFNIIRWTVTQCASHVK